MVQSLTNLATFLRKYKLIATNSINRSVSQSGARILLGLLKNYRHGMILGAIIGNAISLITLSKGIRISSHLSDISNNSIKRLIKENINFPKYDLPSNILNSVSSHCPPILLAFFFSDSVIGLFSMAHTLLYIPISFFGSSVSQLYYKDASENLNLGKSISNLTRRFFVMLFAMGTVFMCLLIICEDWLFGVVLGDNWREVGHYAVLLSPWILLTTPISPLSPVFAARNKLNIIMNLNIFGVIVRVISILFIASLYNSGMLTIFSFGIASTIFYILEGYYVLKLGKVKFYSKDRVLLYGLSALFIFLYFWKLSTLNF